MTAAISSVVIGLLLSAIVYLSIGYVAYRAGRSNVEDYFVASRTFGTFFTVFALGATLFSMWFFLGAAGFYYHHGVGWTANVTANLLIGTMSILLGTKLWRLAKQHNSITHAEVLARAFNSEAIRVIVALVGILFTIPYIALQIKGAGAMVASATDGQISFFWGSLFFFSLVTGYTFIGGQRSVVWTEALQGFILLIFALALAYIAYAVAVTEKGPFFGALLAASPESLTLPGPSGRFEYTWYLSIIFLFGIGFPMFPFINSRYLLANGERTLWKAAPWVALWMGFGLYIPLVSGFAGRLLFPELKGAAADNVLPMILSQFASGATIVLIMGAYAAALSTVSSQVISVAAIVTRDFVQKVPGRKEEKNLLVSRISVLVISILAFIFASMTPKALIELGIMATAGAAQLFVATAVAFWWKGKVQNAALVASTLTGIALVSGEQIGLYKLAIPVHIGVVALLVNFAVFVVLQVILSSRREVADRA